MISRLVSILYSVGKILHITHGYPLFYSAYTTKNLDNARFFYFYTIVLFNIEISWRGDYELSFEEQSAHEFFVDQMQHKLERHLQSYSWPKHVLYLNLYYFPENRQFQLKESQGLNDRINEAINASSALRKHFITS